jgi:hypothetical protein
MKEMKKEIENIEKGESWDNRDEVVQVEIKKPLEMVIPIRLSREKWEQIRIEAKDLGIGPTTLARMWILERLKQNTNPTKTTATYSVVREPKPR